jgi:DNA-binding CsgD family transcriptional regulator
MWSEAELTFIPDKGFRLLNQVVPPEIIQTLTAEAIGSPHLMQDFCRAICRQAGVNEASSESTTIFLGDEKVTRVFHDVAESIGRPIFEKLASGPRQRSDRVQRVLKDGREVDIYQLVLLALADLRPGLITLEYEELRSAIRELSASRIPQIHEIVRVLKHMAVIAATDHSSTPVVDFEENEKKLHITDPFFAFYLRWGNLAAVIQDRRRPLVEPLTNRELDILELLAQQLNNKEIAEKLFISNSTVKAHLVNIYRKLNVPNRREAIEKTMKIGILSGR